MVEQMLTLHINLFAVFHNPSIMFVAPQPGEKKACLGTCKATLWYHPTWLENPSDHATGGDPWGIVRASHHDPNHSPAMFAQVSFRTWALAPPSGTALFALRQWTAELTLCEISPYFRWSYKAWHHKLCEGAVELGEHRNYAGSLGRYIEPVDVVHTQT